MSQSIAHQHQLNELYPGSAGGRALARKKDPDYFKTIGSRGGRATVHRYGFNYMRQLASAGGREKSRRLYTWPASIIPWPGVLERRIPYWPPRASKRRRRPTFVYIEITLEGGA